jgi:1-acyl-sn-glycerol-3-phosphate acyltransferase
VIFVANHSSHFDTPALLISLPAGWRRRTVVAAAADYFYGRRLLADAVSLAFGTVPLERRGRGLDTDAIGHIGQLLSARWSLVVFAEGTRSRDGRVGRLRAGAAMLAARHGVPIVPVHISGSRAAMPPGRRWMVRPKGRGRFARHTIRVSFGAPIRVAPSDDPLEAMERVRLFMAACGADTTPDPKFATQLPAASEQAGQTASASGGAEV